MSPLRAGRLRGRSALRALLALAQVAALLALPALARAHDVSYSYMNVAWDPARLAIRLTVHRDDAAAALGLAAPESLMSPGFLAHEAGRLARIVERDLSIEEGGRARALRLTGALAEPARHGVTLAFDVPAAGGASHLHLRVRLFTSIPQHETFLNVYSGGRLVRQDVLTAEHDVVDLYGRGPAGVLAVVRTFVGAGIHHIFIGPDHILFIVGLLLLGGGVGRVLRVATAFTVAHSLTLALAALGQVAVPGRIVEPAIALSIVYVGCENLRARPGSRDWRTRIAFVFGLVHGFGFASVLREFGLPREALGWSLVAFNLGVEIGQACIVLAVTPLLGLLRSSRPRLAQRAVLACSWAIVGAGAYWFVQRVIARG